MAKKTKSKNAYKNRHVEHNTKDQPCSYVFPDAEFSTKRFCNVNDILGVFVPVKKKESAE